MSTNRAGAYVPPAMKAERASFLIDVKDNEVKINGEDWRKLGFTRGTAQDQAELFVEALHELSNRIITGQKGLNVWAPDYAAQLDQSLRLDAAAAEDTLRALREAGATLRSKLSKEVLEDFDYISFNFLRGGEEPALAFIETVKDANTAPVLWEMMYEGQNIGAPDWRQFWGFRVPLAYWGSKVRTERISLDNGVFAATNEGLPYAGQEVTVLTDRIGAGVKCESLQELLRERARQALAGEELNWQDKNWLARFFQLQQDKKKLTKHGVSDWKKLAWLEIFKSRPSAYSLIHFACHCTPSERSEFLSRLDLRVGGEELCLDAGFISGDMSRPDVKVGDPGPLVFLNACGTAKPSPKQRPPGFPLTWIRNQSALAVVVTLCPVPDYFAHKFASKFYEILSDAVAHPDTPVGRRNRYVAEALLLTRCHFMEQYNNPLGLAYVLHGMRNVHVEASFLAPGGDA